MVVIRALSDTDSRVRTAACWVFAEQSEPVLTEASASAVEAMWAPTRPQLAVMALRAAGAHKEIGSDAGLLEIIGSDEPWLAAEAFSALVRRAGGGLDEVAKEWFSSEELWRRRAVAAAAPDLGEAGKRRLLWMTRPPCDSHGSRTSIPTTSPHGSRFFESWSPTIRIRLCEPWRSITWATPVRPGAFLHCSASLESWASDEMPDARAAALTAALAVAQSDEEQTLVMRRAVDDRDPAVAILVINAARSAGLPARSTERELRHNHRWYLDLVDWMQGSHWLDVATDRGTFRIRLETMDAPITAREIFDLAAAGFYDGLTFHRVVPELRRSGRRSSGRRLGRPGVHPSRRTRLPSLRLVAGRHRDVWTQHRRQPVLCHPDAGRSSRRPLHQSRRCRRRS